MNTFDLQIQSIASDGAHTTSEIVEMARDAGILTIALTDHDTVAGVAGALEAGRAAGVRVIPGIEMSVEVARPSVQGKHGSRGARGVSQKPH